MRVARRSVTAAVSGAAVFGAGGSCAWSGEPEVVRIGGTTVVLTEDGAGVAASLGRGARLLPAGTDGLGAGLGGGEDADGAGETARDMVFIDRDLTDRELGGLGVTEVGGWSPVVMSVAQDGGAVRGNPFRPEIGRGTTTNRPGRSGSSAGFTFTPGIGNGPYYPVYDQPYYPYYVYRRGGLYIYGSYGARIDRYGSTAPLGTRYYQGPINGLVSGTPVIIAGDGSITLSQPEPAPTPSPVELAVAQLRSGQAAGASRTLEGALRTDASEGEEPDDADAPAEPGWDRAEARRLLGVSTLLEGSMGDGIALIRQAYADDPSLCDRPLDHGGFLRSAQMTELVKRTVAEAHDRESSSGWFAVVVLMQSEGRDARALKLLDRADAAFLDAGLSERMRAALAR